jgi:hypothetical protein
MKLDDLMIGLHIQLLLHVAEPHKARLFRIVYNHPLYQMFCLLQFRFHDYHISFYNVGA